MKQIILTFSAYYLPGFRGGGPIRTIANMVDRLGDDFEFWIVTSDRDMGDSVGYPNIKSDVWSVVGKAKVFYASPSKQTLLGFTSIIRKTQHDLLYLNSFFHPMFTLAPIIARWFGLTRKIPLIVAPRGEFSTGALRLKSWKKRPFIKFVDFLDFFNGAVWHVSTALEASDVQRALCNSEKDFYVSIKTIIAPDLIRSEAIVNSRVSLELNKGTFRICFLSRIAPMKNLSFALKVLGNVKSPLIFNIFGPIEDIEYWNKCLEIIEQLPIHIIVNFCGSVDHENVRKTIGEHNIFFVPSLGENFGHVYIEALEAGVPLLVSDQTPWRDLENQGLGWDISLNCPELFVSAIETASRFDVSRREEMKSNCLNFALQKADDVSAVELNRALFSTALAKII